jgi:carbon storage regulator
MLILTRQPSESIMIGEEVTVVVLDVRGTQVRLGVQAPKHIPVNREEVAERIKRERLQAR